MPKVSLLESRMDTGSWAFSEFLETARMTGRQTHRSYCGGFGLHCLPRFPCAISKVSAIRRRVSSPLYDAQIERSAAAAVACIRAGATGARNGRAILPVAMRAFSLSIEAGNVRNPGKKWARHENGVEEN